MLKKILKGFLALVVLIVVLFIAFIGPWPTYKDSHYRDTAYYKKALADIDANAKTCDITDKPDHLRAGWAKADITPEIGIPLAGYGARRGKPSTGVRDHVHVRALALSDGKDTVVLVGADMLITAPEIAKLTREKVAAATPLTANNILFNASHTHCGPGGWAPGLAGLITGGGYDPKMPEFYASKYAEAIIDAYKNMKPAKLANGEVAAPEYIHNRARDHAPVDPSLMYIVVEQEGGKRCYLVRYSAHPTTFGSEQLEFSAEYPGELMKDIEEATHQDAEYLGGAVGAMGPSAPKGKTADDRVRAMGKALADLVLQNTQQLNFRDHLDVVVDGTEIGMAQFQFRPQFPPFTKHEDNTEWRLSPYATKLAGLYGNGWIHAARVGDIVFVGGPCDLCGEISLVWKDWAKAKNYSLWTLSFCGTYCGYFSPDEYYNKPPLGYETGLMNWFGPNNTAYFTDLFHHLVEVMEPPQKHAA